MTSTRPTPAAAAVGPAQQHDAVSNSITTISSTTTSRSCPQQPPQPPPPPSQRDWTPRIPRPLQRLFDAVPLVTYPANELPSRSPAPSELPTLHVFITREGAARGLPSYNPSCLKWQTFLRIANIPHNLTPSTNHASPTGALPFLQPALPRDRLDARALLPIPSSRLDTYARRHGTLSAHAAEPKASIATATATATAPDQRHHRLQTYQALLAHPIRNAWLYALYLSPPNGPLLHALYINPVSRAPPIRHALAHQLRAAARAELANTPTATTTTSWASSLGGNVGDILTWALAGGGGGLRAALDPEAIYADARRAFDALETLLAEGESECESEDGAPPPPQPPRRWFFGVAEPGLFDAHVFSYTYLILHDDYYAAAGLAPELAPEPLWRDDTLRSMVRERCPGLVAHAARMWAVCWPEQQGVAGKRSSSSSSSSSSM